MSQKNDVTFPKAGRIRIRDRISYIFYSLISIFRNKRRSISMIAGLILGISILSGILLYSTVLMNNVYDTVIEGSPYEIRMDFKGSFSDTELEEYRQEFSSNIKISDAQFLYGNARTILEQTATSTSMYTPASLKAAITVEYNNQTISDSEGRIFSINFYYSEIGRRFLEKLITGNDPEIYISGSPFYHGIIIPETLAEQARVQQGNILSHLELTIVEQDPDNIFSQEIISSIKLENVTISGITTSESEASAGLFTDAILGTGGEIYVPEELLADQNKLTFLEDLKENEMKYAVIKINEAEFDLTDPQRVNSQINQLINEYEQSDNVLIGTNLVSAQLLPFQILSIFVFVFDGVLTIPVAILSLYLLSFGIDLSLHERRYQVGILKTQGASPRQIKRRVLMETFFLAAFGLIIGYIIAIFGAWGIGTATGFMKWNWDYALTELPDFFYFDQTAFFIVGGLIVLILFFMVNGKTNTFIQMEITESVRRSEETKKPNFLRRNNLDLIFFAIGLFVLLSAIAVEFGISINLGIVGTLLALLGPPLFWIGGAAVVARLAIWLPPKLDPIVRKIGFLKDVSLMIKGNVFRKAGDIPRLSLIIALTVSFSILAAIQGTTGEVHQERLITFDIGADMSITTTTNFSTTIITNIKSSASDIEEVMALSSSGGLLLNDPVTIFSIDSETYGSVGKWQSDSLPPGQPNKDEILAEMSNKPITNVLMGKSIMQEKALDVGDNITLDFLTYYWNGSEITFGLKSHNVTIEGIFDHAPGGIVSTGILIDHRMLNYVSNITGLAALVDTLPPEFLELIPVSIKDLLDSFLDDYKGVLASRYLVRVAKGSNVNEIESAIKAPENTWLISVKTLKEEIRKSNEIQQMDFGIPGLLTADFVISLLAATLATFIFMSILMEQRKKEFAILRSYGASQKQIYKLVFSETIVLLLISVLWGLIIGIGLSILFNGFFEFMDIFITPLSTLVGGSSINRIIIFDWIGLFLTLGATFIAMLIATFLSVYGSAKAKISTVVREL